MFEEEPILTNRAQTLDQMSIEELHERIRVLRSRNQRQMPCLAERVKAPETGCKLNIPIGVRVLRY